MKKLFLFLLWFWFLFYELSFKIIENIFLTQMDDQTKSMQELSADRSSEHIKTTLNR